MNVRRWILTLSLGMLMACDGCKPKPPIAQGAAPIGPVVEPDALKPNFTLAPGQTADPIAVRLCEIINTTPVAKKAECLGASEPGLTITSQCIDVLGGAMARGKIAIAEPDVDRCKAAMDAALADCSFAKQFNPPIPAACDGIITGTLEGGMPCGSALECKAGFQCFGVGPTSYGRCTVPAPVGTMCGTGVDALATYTRQTSAERTRPACEGYCRLNRCLAFHAPGAECASDVQCGPAHRCADKKCAPR